VDFAGSDVFENHREFSAKPGSAGAPEGGVFRHAEFVHEISREARASSFAMDAARFDFAEVRQKRGQDLVGATHQTACAQVELAIGDVVEAVSRCGGLSLSVHARMIHPEISGLWWALSAVFSAWDESAFVQRLKGSSCTANGSANGSLLAHCREPGTVARGRCQRLSLLA
jgi:hypothetical protein